MVARKITLSRLPRCRWRGGGERKAYGAEVLGSAEREIHLYICTHLYIYDVYMYVCIYINMENVNGRAKMHSPVRLPRSRCRQRGERQEYEAHVFCGAGRQIHVYVYVCIYTYVYVKI